MIYFKGAYVELLYFVSLSSILYDCQQWRN